MSFFNIVAFSLFVWPSISFAVLATIDKLSADKYDSNFRIAVANVYMWCAGTLILIFALSTRTKSMEYAYVGSVLAHSVFFIRRLPNWDRIGMAYFIFACVVYASLVLDSLLLLPYFVIFAFFRSIQSVTPAILLILEKVAETKWKSHTFLYVMRYLEILILACVCAASVWAHGYVDPIIIGLNFVTVYGTQFLSFIQKKSDRA
jgi:hypothetical protein